MEKYSNGGSTLEFYENQFKQVYMEINGEWISIPYSAAIKIGQALVEIGEKLENEEVSN